MSSLGRRVKELREKKKWSRSRLAKELGLRPQSVDDWEKEKTFPRGKRLELLAEILDTNVIYLLTGNDPNSQEDDTLLQMFHLPNINNDITFNVPLIVENENEDKKGKSQVSIGEASDKKTITLSKQVLDDKKILIDNIACMVISDNSMFPYLPDNTLVAIDSADITISDGKIYALIIHNEFLRIRLVLRLPNNKLRIRSFDSNNFPDEIYDLDDVKILGRMFWAAVFW